MNNAESQRTVEGGLATEEDIQREANWIYDRGHYFPGKRPATRERIVAEIAKALRAIRDGEATEVCPWDRCAE